MVGGVIGFPTRPSMPPCSRPSRTLRAAGAVARRRAILDGRCARRRGLCAGRDGRMVPIEQKDGGSSDGNKPRYCPSTITRGVKIGRPPGVKFARRLTTKRYVRAQIDYLTRQEVDALL